MQPAGLQQVDAAAGGRPLGRRLRAAEPATVPPDFQRALDRNPEAKAFFETLTGTSRYAFLYRLHDAKRPETRAKRIEHIYRDAEQERDVYP